MNTPQLLIGGALLLLGRRLFWLFLMGVGFAAGSVFALELVSGQEGWMPLAIALGAGLVGALLALMAQKLAVGVAGFLAGGYLAYVLAGTRIAELPPWAVFVIGGILGAILLALLFNWALIALSSLVGAALVSQALPIAPPWQTVLFVALGCVGLAVQTRLIKVWPRATEAPKKE